MPTFSTDFGELFGGTTSASVQALITKCLTAVGINADDTEYRARALVFLNFVYLNRLKGRHWKFTNREAFVDLKPAYEAGTVALTIGTNGVTEDTAPPVIAFTSLMVGQTFVPQQDDQDVYRILLVPTAQSLTLASQYTGATAAGSSYKILFDRVSLEVGVQAVRSVVVAGVGEIAPMGLQAFRNLKSMNPSLVGRPQYFTLVEAETGSGQWTLELYPAPDKRYSAQIEYSVRPVGLVDETTCFTLIPSDHLDVLYYGVLADLYRVQENGAMAASAAKDAANSWVRFASDHEMTDSTARIQHARGYLGRQRARHRGYYGLKWFGRVDD